VPHLILAALDPLGIIMTIIGLGGLIFFHELGHFLACRLTGTRVEAFSIGFGPEIFGWRRGNTRYRIALIPLGGYVKMAAENPGDANTGAPDEFPNKSFGQRLFIMSNGVIFNILLAFLLYIWAFGLGVQFPKSEIGMVTPGAPGWRAGLLPGDVVTKVNGRSILGFDDLSTEVAFSGEGEVLKLTVLRGGKELVVDVEPEYSEARGLPIIDVAPAFDPEMHGVGADSPAAKAGGEAGDVLVSINGVAAENLMALQRMVTRTAGTAPADAKEVKLALTVRRRTGKQEVLELVVPIADRPQIGIHPYAGNVVRKIAQNSPAEGLLRIGDRILSVNGRKVEDFRTMRDRDGTEMSVPVKTLVIERNGASLTLSGTGFTQSRLFQAVAGETSLSTTVVSPRLDMPAARAGMRAGDKIIRVGSTKVTKWAELHKAVLDNGRKQVTVTIERDGETRDLTLVPAGTITTPLLGYEIAQLRVIQKEKNILSAVRMGARRTMLAAKSVMLTIRSLITRRVSARHIGGPITLARVTYGMFDVGAGRYLYILALISINLAILNILPIPVLDGGQIVLLCAEKLRGKPLPDKVVGYFQMVGLLLILSLLVLAFRNDIVNLLQ